MPRSGTTLVEQIISSHNKVYGAGELHFYLVLFMITFLMIINWIKKKLLNSEFFKKFN